MVVHTSATLSSPLISLQHSLKSPILQVSSPDTSTFVAVISWIKKLIMSSGFAIELEDLLKLNSNQQDESQLGRHLTFSCLLFYEGIVLAKKEINCLSAYPTGLG